MNYEAISKEKFEPATFDATIPVFQYKLDEAEKELRLFAQYVDRWAVAEGFTKKHNLRRRAAKALLLV